MATRKVTSAGGGGGSGGSSGTQYTEDAAAAADPIGTMLMLRRRDTPNTGEVSADGDNIAGIATNKGELRTNDAALNTILAAMAAVLATPILADNAAFSPGSSTVEMAGFEADENLPVSVSEGFAGAARMSLNRNVYTQIRDLSAERSMAVTAANAAKVDGSAVTQPVSTASLVVSVTPTVSASPDYSIGDAVGGTQTLANAVRVSGGCAVLQSIQIVDNAAVKPVVDILFFDSNPSGSTVTDNAAFVFSTGKAKLIGRISVAATDYCTAINSTCVANKDGLGKLLMASGGTSLYVAVVAQAAINLAATDDLRFDYAFLRD